jgi:hypothetical protein
VSIILVSSAAVPTKAITGIGQSPISDAMGRSQGDPAASSFELVRLAYACTSRSHSAIRSANINVGKWMLLEGIVGIMLASAM